MIHSLKNWENIKLVNDALTEIITIHKRYRFAAKSPEDAENYIKNIMEEIR